MCTSTVAFQSSRGVCDANGITLDMALARLRSAGYYLPDLPSQQEDQEVPHFEYEQAPTLKGQTVLDGLIPLQVLQDDIRAHHLIMSIHMASPQDHKP